MVLLGELDINIKSLRNATKKQEVQDWLEDICSYLGLNYNSQNKVFDITSHGLIKDIVIDVAYNIKEKELQNWVQTKGLFRVEEYKNAQGVNPILLILISESHIYYFSRTGALIDKRITSKESLNSFFGVFLEPSVIDSKQFALLFGINSPFFLFAYSELKEHFLSSNKNKSDIFQQWQQKFHLAYNDNQIGLELFLKHSYLSMLLKLSLYKEFMESDEYRKASFNKIGIYFENLGIPLFHHDFFHWVIEIKELCSWFFERIKRLTFKATDIFRVIYQEMIIAGVRHKLGEYYTPENLCKLMVEKEYKIGMRVLDSSCGSGTFLIEILKQIDRHFRVDKVKKPPDEWFNAVNNLFGYDINPIAILTSKANLLLYLKSKKKWINDISVNIYLTNALDSPEKLSEKKMDLIITNPPWLTYKDADQKLRSHLKKISEDFDIKPGAHNVTNIEEAIIFLFRIPDMYLRKDGKGRIAFVLPRSILVSSQNEKARRFDCFEDIEFFEFNDMVFNIDCCCFFATFIEETHVKKDPMKQYPAICKIYDAKSLKLLKSVTLEPYVYFKKKPNEKLNVKRLIEKKKKKQLFPVDLSDYYSDFIQGADLIPKSLLYVEIEGTLNDGQFSIINPWISPQAKGKWKNQYFSNQKVESNHLFKASLSRGLYPFYIDPFDIFLPLDESFIYNISHLGKNAKKHWKYIQEVYREVNDKDLFEVGINYRNKLCRNSQVRKSQRKPYKIVFPNAKRLMAAVIEDPKGITFIDSTLYYFGTENKEEAFYLCGILNIRELRKSVKTISDTRHHHKRPLYFHIPRYVGTKSQSRIANLSEECYHIVRDYVISEEKPKMKHIKKLIEKKYEIIKKLGLEILNNTMGTKVIKEYLLKKR